MPRHVHSVLALAPLVFLAACGGGNDTATPTAEATAGTPAAVAEATPVAAATPISYDCLPAHLLTVAYDNSGATPTATLTLDGSTHVLSQIPAASGAKYASDEGLTAGKSLIWWTLGEHGKIIERPIGGPDTAELTLAECGPSGG